MTFNEYFYNQMANQANANIKLAQQDAINKDAKLIFKIKRHIKRFKLNYTVDQILNEIIKSDLLASTFAKTTQRQNSSEKYQLKFLQAKGIDIKNLGNNAFRLNKGKSLDFIEGTNRYFFAKVTNQRGGGQDNQYKDILAFLKEASKDKYNHLEFVILADGDYYREEKEVKEMKKFEKHNIIISNSDKYGKKRTDTTK